MTVAGAVDGRPLAAARGDATPAPGIDPALLPHVFDRFVKGDASRGSGLGLAIARQLVEAHGGEIDRRVGGAGVGNDDPGPTAAYGRVIRTSSTAASTVLRGPRSAASNTIRTFLPAHGAIGTLTVAQAGRSRVRGAELLASPASGTVGRVST